MLQTHLHAALDPLVSFSRKVDSLFMVCGRRDMEIHLLSVLQFVMLDLDLISVDFTLQCVQ